MKARGTQRDGRSRAALTAEASAWLARLHGPNRTREVEEGFRRWMNESPEHAAAFEHMTDTWEKSAQLRRRPLEHVARWELPGFRVSFSRAAIATAAVAVLAVVGTLFYLHTGPISTAVGEQRILTLEDGSRVYLNTATRAVVHYDESVRRVELDKGEALFEVAKRPDWPFVVVAGDRRIRALGTSFIVRRDEHNLAVTLVDGKVTVVPSAAPASMDSEVASLPATQPRDQANDPARLESPGDVITLLPGQRVTFVGTRAPRLDRPVLDRMTAWQRGQVALDNLPLAEAVAEMNRYSRKQLVVESAHAESIRVSGIFRSGDVANFAQAVAKTYGLRVVDESKRIVLTDTLVPADAG